MDAEGLKIVDAFEEFPQGSAQAIEACDTKAITRAGVVNEFREAGAVEGLSSNCVGEDADSAFLEKAEALGVGILVNGGYAGVAEGVAGSLRPGIDRFWDSLCVGHFLGETGLRSISLFVSK